MQGFLLVVAHCLGRGLCAFPAIACPGRPGGPPVTHIGLTAIAPTCCPRAWEASPSVNLCVLTAERVPLPSLPLSVSLAWGGAGTSRTFAT